MGKATTYFKPLSSKMWSKTWVSDPFPAKCDLWKPAKGQFPFSWPKNDQNEAFLVKNYIKKFQAFKMCFLKAFKEARGLFSLFISSHTFSHFLTSDTFSHLSAKSYHAGPKPAIGAIWVRPHLLMQFRAKSYHVSPKHLGAIWVRPHPAKQFCGKSYHVFQTPFLQNVVQNLGFRPLSSKMWSKTWVSDPFPAKCDLWTFLVKNYMNFQGFKMCFLKAFKEARGLFSLFISSHTFSHFLTSDTFSHLSAKSYHAGPKPAIGAIWVRPHLLMQFRAKSYHVSPKHLGAIWVRPHPAKQFCGKSYHVFQTPFLQNVV